MFESIWLALAGSERAERASDEDADAIDYRPELGAADLIIEVRRLLTTERRAERLICRYLADLADRIRARSDVELEVFLDEFDAARTIFGLGARETRERIRIGRALRQLPRVEHSFIAGDVSYSRVREVTRVAQPDTESDWLELAQSLDMRALERRVASATREAAAARATGEGTAGGAGEEEGGAGECNGWTVDVDGWTVDVDGGASVDANRSPNHWTSGDSVTRPPSRPTDDGANDPAPRRRVRACTEWTGRDSVRVTFELSAEAWAIVERALEDARRRAAVTPVREGEALEGDRHRDPAARSEGMAHRGVAPLDDGEALEALARVALSAQSASDRDAADPRRTVVVDECDRCGASDLDTGLGTLARLPASAITPSSGAPEERSASAGTLCSGAPPEERTTRRCGALEERRNAEADVLVSGPREPGFNSISHATQGGSSTVATIRLLQIIGRSGRWTIDELIDRSGLDVTEVQHALLLLELDDRIRRRCNEIDPT